MTDVKEKPESFEATDEQVADRLVPVAEAIRYRKRAQTAEQQLDATRSELEQIESQLTESQQLIASLEKRQKIDALLAESDVIDLEAARLLTERVIEEMDEPDVKLAIDDLRRHKPYLFHRSQQARLMSAAVQTTGHELDHVAAEARASGDRRDLLRYLRLRRQR